MCRRGLKYGIFTDAEFNSEDRGSPSSMMGVRELQVEVVHESQYLSKNKLILVPFYHSKPKLSCSYEQETHINVGT